MKFQVVFEKHGRWYVGYVPEVPGVHSQERTLKEARRSLVLALKELSQIDPRALFGRKRRIEELEVRVGK